MLRFIKISIYPHLMINDSISYCDLIDQYIVSIKPVRQWMAKVNQSIGFCIKINKKKLLTLSLIIVIETQRYVIYQIIN